MVLQKSILFHIRQKSLYISIAISKSKIISPNQIKLKLMKFSTILSFITITPLHNTTSEEMKPVYIRTTSVPRSQRFLIYNLYIILESVHEKQFCPNQS